MATQAAIGLGRVFDVLPVAAANPVRLRGANAISFVAVSSGAATITVQGQKVFGGSGTNWTTANGFGQPSIWHQQAGNDGTHQWTKQTASWSTATLTIAATNTYTSVVTFFATQFADGFPYIVISANANTTSIMAIIHDLSVGRTPANLEKLGA